MEELISEIVDELKIEMEISEDSDIRILELKTKNAYREVYKAFNFKPWHDDEFVSAEMSKAYTNIKNLAMYDFAKVGGEGETEHREKNITRVYVDRRQCFSGIVPFAD